LRFLWAVVVIAIIVFTVQFLSFQLEVRGRFGTNEIYSVQSQYLEDKQNFCHERSVIPCSDDEIWKWNDAHPNDTFEVKSLNDPSWSTK
jgi:hypothetical protein